jgi:hypothetical protein
MIVTKSELARIQHKPDKEAMRALFTGAACISAELEMRFLRPPSSGATAPTCLEEGSPACSNCDPVFLKTTLQALSVYRQRLPTAVELGSSDEDDDADEACKHPRTLLRSHLTQVSAFKQSVLALQDRVAEKLASDDLL